MGRGLCKAETELDVVKERHNMRDSYVALMDVYWWSAKIKAIAIAK
jgi:hypothetical protein